MDKRPTRIINKDGFIEVLIGREYKLQHLVVGEAKIGRPLKKNEQVIWMNGIVTDNRIENIEVVVKKTGFKKFLANVLDLK